MKTLISLLLLTAAFTPARSQTTLQQLTGAPWPIVSIGLDYDGDGTADRDFTEACDAGTTMTFNADGTGAYFRGATPCDKAKPVASPFTYAAEGAGKFSMTLDGKTEPVSVKAADAKNLTLYFTKTKALFVFKRP